MCITFKYANVSLFSLKNIFIHGIKLVVFDEFIFDTVSFV